MLADFIALQASLILLFSASDCVMSADAIGITQRSGLSGVVCEVCEGQIRWKQPANWHCSQPDISFHTSLLDY